MGLSERLQKRADQFAGWIASSKILVDLLKPQMDLFDARTGQHDLYAVRMSVDHTSNMRTQQKELDDLLEAIATIDKLKGYARHTRACRATYRGNSAHPSCDCGLTKLLKGLEDED